MWETWHTPPNLLAVNPMIENVLALNKEDTPQNRSEQLYVDIKLRCCVSGMFIPDPKTAMKDRGGKKFVVIPFFWSHKFHKIELFYFEMLKKKIWANFQIIIELFTQKIVTRLSKIWVWDPGSRGQKGNGSRIRISNTVKLREWYGAVPNRVATGGRFCRKTQKWPAKCVYCVWRTIFPPAAEICARLAGNFCQ